MALKTFAGDLLEALERQDARKEREARLARVRDLEPTARARVERVEPLIAGMAATLCLPAVAVRRAIVRLVAESEERRRAVLEAEGT